MWPKQLKINTYCCKHNWIWKQCSHCHNEAIYISLIKFITLKSDELDRCPTKSCYLSSLTSRVQAQRIYKAEWTLTTWFRVVWMPYVDTQVQSLLGWYTAIILPCQGLITLAPLPQSISVWRSRLVGFWQLLSGWVSLLRSMPACIRGGAALRRTQQVGLLPLLWQDNKRICLLGGQDFRARVLILLCYLFTVFSVKYLQEIARLKEEGFYKSNLIITLMIVELKQSVDGQKINHIKMY